MFFEFCYIGDTINSFDFDPTGVRAATIDGAGVCLVSDIDTNRRKFHMKLGRLGNLLLHFYFSNIYGIDDEWSRCRWSTLPG